MEEYIFELIRKLPHQVRDTFEITQSNHFHASHHRIIWLKKTANIYQAPHYSISLF